MPYTEVDVTSLMPFANSSLMWAVFGSNLKSNWLPTAV